MIDIEHMLKRGTDLLNKSVYFIYDSEITSGKLIRINLEVNVVRPNSIFNSNAKSWTFHTTGIIETRDDTLSIDMDKVFKSKYSLISQLINEEE